MKFYMSGSEAYTKEELLQGIKALLNRNQALMSKLCKTLHENKNDIMWYQRRQKDQDELDEKVSYTITVSGLDEYADKMCLASVGKVIFISTNIYEVNECPKDSDLVVTFVTTNTEDKRTINLKSNTYKHDK